jgi:hypothetical protein
MGSGQWAPTPRRVAPGPSRLAALLSPVALCLLPALFPSPAFGHKFDHPKRDALTISAEGLALEIAWELGPSDEALKLRRLFDENSDGDVDAGEAEKLLDYLAAAALSTVKLRLDGARVALTRESREGDGARGQADRSSTIALKLTLSARAPITAGLHVVELSDRAKEIGGQVPAEVTLSGGLAPVISSLGAVDFVAGKVGPAHLDGSARLKVVFVAP